MSTQPYPQQSYPMDTYPEYRKPPTQPPPPKPKKEGQTELNIALAVVLAVVLILFGLFAYISLSGLRPPDCVPEPNVQFWAAEASGPNEWEVQIAGVSEAKDYGNYQAVLLRDGVQQGEVMNPLQETTVGNITFSDLDGAGRLNIGDYFTITTWPGGSYKLVVVWRDSGKERGWTEWET